MKDNIVRLTDGKPREAAIAIGGFALGLTMAAVLTHWPGGSPEWAAWVQAVGALLALGVAVGVATWQVRISADRDVRIEQQQAADNFNAEMRVLTMTANLIERMALTVSAMLDGQNPMNRGRYNLRADARTIVTLGDLLEALALEIRNGDVLGEVVEALSEVAYYRVMAENNDYRDGPNPENPFEHQHQRIVEIVDHLYAAGIHRSAIRISLPTE
ncbi:hypothetical protein [Paraburkholderia caribensis]|uniref:hypothetical protein n=1 Tax=Paraburkholderia caribensis TaxID=75105 RepID=UPI0031CE5344